MIVKVKPVSITLICNAFIIFHLIAIILTPVSSESDFLKQLHKPFDGYVKLFHLFNGWSFFAPNPKMNAIITYNIEFKDGTTKSYTPILSHNKNSLTYFRNARMLDIIGYNSEVYAKPFAVYLYKNYGLGEIQNIEIIISHQKRVHPQDYTSYRQSFIIDKPYIKYIFSQKDLSNDLL